MILYKIQEFWHEQGFRLLVFLSIFFMFVYGLSRLGKKGSYGSDRYLGPQPTRVSSYSAPASDPRESKLEQACRRSLYEIFGKPFHKARPDFLRNPVTQNFNLELDCFNPELRLAVEGTRRTSSPNLGPAQMLGIPSERRTRRRSQPRTSPASCRFGGS